MYENVFIDKYKWKNVMKDYKIFLKKIEELKSYIIEFNKNKTMKLIVYLSDCAIEKNN